MDDICAVCAETLEWAAYGQCGHREVCSTCIARLRFVCDDRRCCICKFESNFVFVTKALGDYTRMINDFLIFPADPVEGQVGPYWYHEGTQAFFDDIDHYKMIAAMCKLSCIVCDAKDEQGREGSKRRVKFKNIEHLKNHLFHLHTLFMCHLCLKGRKIFICEQKLYTIAQLNRHMNNGDSEVDGSEIERGGFMGHPMCEFCQNPYYDDHELYTHMSTEHFTCHICQRQYPGQYDYYKNYDDLEIHFRREHFLCEDEACLAKKFIVFVSESEMKRHNAMEHGGYMSRSKRNAALQIPINFRYRSREQDSSGRRRGFHSNFSESPETASADIPRATSSRAQPDSDHRETSEIDPVIGSFDSLAVGQNSRNPPLEGSSFPPLPRSSHQKPRNGSKRSGRTTMAAHLCRQNNVTVLNSSQARPLATNQPVSNSGTVISSGSRSSSISMPTTVNELVPSNFSSPTQVRSTTKIRSSNKVTHSSTSTPNLVDRDALDPAISDFPPVSAAISNKLAAKTETLPKVDDARTANGSLAERIRSVLEFNEDKYAAFKEISLEYRQGVIGAGEYLAYVHQFGLSHLVLELARLCPDPQKKNELVEAYNSGQPKHKKSSRKGKEKCEDNGISSSNDALANSIIKIHKPSEEVEVLSKDAKTIENHSESVAGGSKKCLGNKPRKKTSKFPRVRLGESSSAAALDLTNSDAGPEANEGQSREKIDKNASESLPARGAWQNGGGRRLVGKLAVTR